MPAGTIELYKPKKTRTRYTTISLDDSSITRINNDYYANPKDEELKSRYLRYFMTHNMSAIGIYENRYKTYTLEKNKDMNRYSILYRDLPPEVTKNFCKYFNLSSI
mgnify:CR=1 FL=1